ncbi:MAG: hypothetical protein MUE64_08935 [Ignavibacteriaceae bacterium]|nr:hypothetical protein [Ignavibacteriaceae bacterium]
MKIVLRYSIIVILLLNSLVFPQVENVPLNHPVYTFLKEMKVKNIIAYISEDVPNLSRFQVKDYLMQVEEKLGELSNTERDFFNRYKVEFLKTQRIFFIPKKNLVQVYLKYSPTK